MDFFDILTVCLEISGALFPLTLVGHVLIARRTLRLAPELAWQGIVAKLKGDPERGIRPGVGDLIGAIPKETMDGFFSEVKTRLKDELKEQLKTLDLAKLTADVINGSASLLEKADWSPLLDQITERLTMWWNAQKAAVERQVGRAFELGGENTGWEGILGFFMPDLPKKEVRRIVGGITFMVRTPWARAFIEKHLNVKIQDIKAQLIEGATPALPSGMSGDGV